MGGGAMRRKIQRKCPSSHNDNTASIKQISMFDTANSHDNYLKFQFKIQKITIDRQGGQNRDMTYLAPLPKYYYYTYAFKEYFTPIRLGLKTSTICP